MRKAWLGVLFCLLPLSILAGRPDRPAGDLQPTFAAGEARLQGWPSQMHLPLLFGIGPTPSAPCSELITNPSFENELGWVMPASSSAATYATGLRNTGLRSALLGLLPGAVEGSSAALPAAIGAGTRSMVWQTVSIPAGATNVTLTFWYYPASQDPTGAGHQDVLLLDASPEHQLLQPLSEMREDTHTWQRRSYDLAIYAGRSITLAFSVYNDDSTSGGRTWMYVDDVSIRSCHVVTPTAVPSPSPRPTRTPGPTGTHTPTPVGATAAPPTVTRTLSPTATTGPACREYVINGDFEKDEGWFFPASGSQASYTSGASHTGLRAVHIGLPPVTAASPPEPPMLDAAGMPVTSHLPAPPYPQVASLSRAYQPLDLVTASGSVTLTFWYNGGMENPTDSGDYQQVVLWDPAANAPVAELAHLRENDRTWKPASFDLSTYDKLLDLDFRVYNDSTGPGGWTWLYVDDVSVMVCP